MLSIYNSAHVSLCNYFSFIVSLFAYYVVLFHVRNKDNNNKKKIVSNVSNNTYFIIYIFSQNLPTIYNAKHCRAKTRCHCSDDLTFAYKSKISAIHCVNSVNETVSYYINKLGKA